jgi:hypothetical protein
MMQAIERQKIIKSALCKKNSVNFSFEGTKNYPQNQFSQKRPLGRFCKYPF